MKRARWITLIPGDPIDEPVLATLVRRAPGPPTLPRPERLWHALDREAGPPAR